MIMRCCVCGADDPTYVMNIGLIRKPKTVRSRYYCTTCWRTLVGWLSGQVALAEGLGPDPSEEERS